MKAIILKLPTGGSRVDELPEPGELSARLEELALLKDGWLDGKGVAPSKTGLRWLAASWPKSFPADLPTPFAYPTPDGGIQLEWTFGKVELSAEIDFSSHEAALMAVIVATGESTETRADLDSTFGWQTLANFVRSRLAA